MTEDFHRMSLPLRGVCRQDSAKPEGFGALLEGEKAPFSEASRSCRAVRRKRQVGAQLVLPQQPQQGEE